MTFVEIFGLIVGLVYLYFEYKADALVWVCSVIMPCISMFIYFQKGLYADFAINIYYLAIAIYGYIAWTRHTRPEADKKQEKPLPITHTPLRLYLPLTLALGVIWLALWWLLVTFTPSTVPVADSFTTALSIVALWMMARKYAEQWLAWLVVDAVCVGLYIYKGLVFYPVLYAIYTVIAVFGYRKWCSMITHQ